MIIGRNIQSPQSLEKNKVRKGFHGENILSNQSREEAKRQLGLYYVVELLRLELFEHYLKRHENTHLTYHNDFYLKKHAKETIIKNAE